MTRPRILFLAILSLVLLLAGSVALAAPVPNNHPNVVVRDAAGAAITNGTTPYSPKQTCAGCHIDNCISTASITTNTNLWCETDAQKSANAKFDDYGSGIKHSTHTQGVIESDNRIYWQSYDVTSFEHGASVGRHSEQGRNEDYNTAMRTSFGDPFFTSSPGMFGKY